VIWQIKFLACAKMKSAQGFNVDTSLKGNFSGREERVGGLTHGRTDNCCVREANNTKEANEE
jgi:hypothetical protein